MKALREAHWTHAARHVYRVYPAAIRSKNWPEIVRLADQGKIDQAKELAAAQEKRSLAVRAENVIARRLRVLSPEKFALRNQTTDGLKTLFETFADKVSALIRDKADGVSSIRHVSAGIHDFIVELRRSMNVLVTDTVWAAVLMGIKHMGEAAKPIFRENQESFLDELGEISEFENPETQKMLLEAQARTRVTARLPGGSRTATANLNTDKWQKITDKIYHDVAKSSLRGLTLSQRVWDLTNRTEQDLKRTIAADIASGKSSRDIADRVSRNIFVKGIDDEFTSGAGVYKSPLKNALRMARTELSRAYVKAQTSWATGRPWLDGLRLTLSDSHDKEDICDDQAGDIFTPEEADGVLPIHPFCMCFFNFVIKDEYLSDPTEEDA